MRSHNAVLLLSALSLAPVAFAQIPSLGPFDPDRGLPSGLQLNDVTMFIGGLDYQVPVGTNGVVASTPLRDYTGGITADVGWYVPGERNQFFVTYGGTYNANVQYSSLNAYNQQAALSWRSKLGRRLILTINGTAQSATVAGFFFEGANPVASAPTPLANDPLAGAVAGQLAPVLTSSPLTLVLYGNRYRAASGGVSLAYLQSPRLQWTFSAQEARALPTTAQTSVTGLQIAGVSNTEGMAGLSYSVSPRTTVSIDASYLQMDTRSYPLRTEMAIAGIRRILTQRLFVHAEGGSGSVTQYGENRLAYHAVAGITTTTVGGHTFSLDGRYDDFDLIGLGAAHTSAANLGWYRNRPGSGWTFGLSGGYQRLQGDGVQLLQGWFGGASLTRQLSTHTKIALQAAYATNSGHAQEGFANLTETNVRLAFIWSPQPLVRAQPR